MSYVSIVIPTYEMHGLGKDFLRHSFNILKQQTFNDFDVVISDHSKNNDIKDLCDEYRTFFPIIYLRNEEKRGNSPANLNNGLRHATGKLIKILFQDDYLYSNTSLKEIVDCFDLQKDVWLVTACTHTKDGKHFYRPFYPYYNSRIQFGKNTISSPSVLTTKNSDVLLFDENLIWHMDVDYYAQMYKHYGEPRILNTINVVNRVGAHQISSTHTEQRLKEKEYAYILNKYGVTYPSLSLLLFKWRERIHWLKRTLKKVYKKII